MSQTNNRQRSVKPPHGVKLVPITTLSFKDPVAYQHRQELLSRRLEVTGGYGMSLGSQPDNHLQHSLAYDALRDTDSELDNNEGKSDNDDKQTSTDGDIDGRSDENDIDDGEDDESEEDDDDDVSNERNTVNIYG